MIAAAVLVAGAAAVVVPAVAATSADTFVASVPWSSAVVATGNGRTLTVLGDVEGMDNKFDCSPVVKSKVSETARFVRVRVEVFNHPLPPNVACGGVGLVTVPATIYLKSPLGTRTLLDSTDKRVHAPLVIDRTPAPSSVPKPFVRRATGWDEATGQVHEWWRWQQHHEAQQIDLELGPTSIAAKWGPPPPDATHISINGRPALLWRETEGVTVSSTVTWSPHAGQSYRLWVGDQALTAMSEADIVALARSVR